MRFEPRSEGSLLLVISSISFLGRSIGCMQRPRLGGGGEGNKDHWESKSGVAVLFRLPIKS